MSDKRTRRKQVSHDLAKVGGPPKGEPWVWHTLELLASPAWRSQSINCRRLIEFLEVEHMHHAGLENGQLYATYDHLVAWGISRRLVHGVISEAEALGLIECQRGGRKRFAETHLSKFRLTYLASKESNERGQKYYAAPTDEWKRVTAKQAAKITGRTIKFLNQDSEVELNQFHNGNFDGSRTGTVEAQKTAENSQSTTVPEVEPPYISSPRASKMRGLCTTTTASWGGRCPAHQIGRGRTQDLRARICEYHGRRLDLRTFMVVDASDERTPTRKGITCPVNLIHELGRLAEKAKVRPLTLDRLATTGPRDDGLRGASVPMVQPHRPTKTHGAHPKLYCSPRWRGAFWMAAHQWVRQAMGRVLVSITAVGIA